MRINYSLCRREKFETLSCLLILIERHFMVIGDYHVDTQIICMSDLIVRRYAVITCDDHTYTVFMRQIDQMIIDTVPIMHTMRKCIVHRCTAGTQATEQNIGRTYAVHIIISDNTYLKSLGYILLYQ